MQHRSKTPTIEFLDHLMRESGKILLKYFGKVKQIRHKENASSVVCEADLAAEERVISLIRKNHPKGGIIAEESGWQAGDDFTFIIDPLDGTSNFVAGLPWFGTQIGVFDQSGPCCAAMYLPLDDVMFLAQRRGNVYRNGQKVSVTSEDRLNHTLVAFGMDPVKNERVRLTYSKMLTRVTGGARNIRATNCLYDFCYTLDGRMGGFVNLNCKIWDIAPIALMLPAAKGTFSDLRGKPVAFDLSRSAAGRKYQVMGASRPLHKQLVRLIR